MVGAEVQEHSFLTSKPDGRKWLASDSGRYSSGEYTLRRFLFNKRWIFPYPA
jgi:hypothetical protein